MFINIVPMLLVIFFTGILDSPSVLLLILPAYAYPLPSQESSSSEALACEMFSSSNDMVDDVYLLLSDCNELMCTWSLEAQKQLLTHQELLEDTYHHMVECENTCTENNR